ncbi:MAG TPA: hypothetical protein VIL36_08625 [Acidimicrobiales bacterium]
MQHGIVEGEPGIFPDPIARLMRGIGRLFDRGRRDGEPHEGTAPEAPPTDGTGPGDDGGHEGAPPP